MRNEFLLNQLNIGSYFSEHILVFQLKQVLKELFLGMSILNFQMNNCYRFYYNYCCY